MKLTSFDWSANDITMFIGPLETKILRALWSYGKPVRFNTFYKYLLTDCNVDIAYTSMVTTLHRMLEKGYIQRWGTTKIEPVYIDETTFVKMCVIKMLKKFQDTFPVELEFALNIKG